MPQINIDTPHVAQLVGNSHAIQRVRKLIRKIAPTGETVLLEGETGTGKDLTAQLIHQASFRRHKPFVPINCAALPSTLIENELFGHARGAFTGASEARRGAVQQAEGGTLFLDEIGEIPLELQGKLLRVIDTKTVSPLGGIEIPVDVRIIAASNRDLKTAVHNGDFRSDLFFRLNTLPVYLPPLRERSTDISTLIDYFLEEFVSNFHQSVRLKTDVYPLLEKYAWPGNVRELKSLLTHVCLLTENSELNVADFTPHLAAEPEINNDALLPLKEAMARYEQEYLCHALEQTGGNKDEAASLLNISRRTFYRKLAKYKL